MTAVEQPFAIEPIRATRTFEAAIENLTEAIERARLRRGDRLPSEAQLVRAFGTSRITVGRALRDLQREGQHVRLMTSA